MNSEKIVLNPESFENISKMLNSPDEENAAVGLMTIAQMDFTKSKMYMVLLYKDSLNKELWEEHCPDVVKNIKNLKLDDVLSFTSIYDQMKKTSSKDEMAVFLDRFTYSLRVMLKNWGYANIMPDVDIKITMKNG